MLLVCTWVWGHSLGHDTIPVATLRKKNDSLLPNSYQLTVTPQLGLVWHKPSPIQSPCWLTYECDGHFTAQPSSSPPSCSYILSVPYSVMFPEPWGGGGCIYLTCHPRLRSLSPEKFPDFPPLVSLSLIKCETCNPVIFKWSICFPVSL